MVFRYTISSLGVSHCRPSCFWHSLPKPFYFHSTSTSRNRDVNYYEVLGVEPNASLSVIKKYNPVQIAKYNLSDFKSQYYALSRRHHPDHNRSDSGATNRFVRISEAYAVLGSPEKRQRYDSDLGLQMNEPTSRGRQGSRSSYTPFGSRPASGLSRRRSQFRGPPPSFYRNGGWGSRQPSGAPQTDSSNSVHASTFKTGWTQSAEMKANWSSDVPHFDRESHFRTQKNYEHRREKRTQNESVSNESDGNRLTNFIVVSGVVSLAYAVSTAISRGGPEQQRNVVQQKSF